LNTPASENHELIEGIRSMMEKHNDVMIDKVRSVLENDMIADQIQGMKGEIQGIKSEEIQSIRGEIGIKARFRASRARFRA
jgi:hypothetical protein